VQGWADRFLGEMIAAAGDARDAGVG
jgi:hypothetical protein